MKKFKDMTNEELIKKYPFLEIKDNSCYTTLPPNKYTWLDDLEDGWREAFGEDLCNELLESLTEEDNLYDFQFSQIKEKYGSLRLYCYGYKSEHTRDILAKYEELSTYICAKCGKPAKVITKGWIFPMCQECFDKTNLKDSVPIEEFYEFDSYDDVLKEIDEIKNNFKYDRYWKTM